MKKLLIASLFILAALNIFASEPPAHILTLQLRDEGFIDLLSLRDGTGLDLPQATAEEQAEALREPDSVRKSKQAGRIAVTGSDEAGHVIFRTIAPVVLEESFAEGVNPVALHNPRFTVSVPTTVSLVTLEGWQPLMHATLDLRQPGRFRAKPDVVNCPQPTVPVVQMKPNFINILVVAEGYLDTTSDRNLFAADYNKFVQSLYQTEPFRRYSSMISIQPFFAVSCDRGAFHPPACGPGAAGIAQGWRSALRSTYCGDNATERLLVIDPAAWDTNVAPFVSRTPEYIIVLVNDVEFGGSGGVKTTLPTPARVTAVAAVRSNGPNNLNSYAPQTALHEMGHIWPVNLGDEYTLDIGFPGCTTNCPPNVVRSPGAAPDMSAIPWQGWLSAPYPICLAGQACPVGEHVPGLFQGAFGSNDYWRSEKNCLMRQSFVEVNPGAFPVPPPSYYCHVCTDNLILGLYSRVDPFSYVVEKQQNWDIRNILTARPTPILSNTSLELGIDMLPPVGAPDWRITWRNGRWNGTPIPNQNATTYTYVATGAGTRYITMEIEDPTLMVLEPEKPPHMHRFYTWEVISVDPLDYEIDWVGPFPVPVPKRYIPVPRGTQFVNLQYSIHTSEMGRSGDQWHIAVGFGGPTASSLTAQEDLFYIEGTAANPEDNVSNKIVRIDLGGAAQAGDITLALEVGGKAGEAEGETNLPTRITASLSPDPSGCGDQCDYCTTHPNDPTCPLNTSISAVAIPIADTSETHNIGDSTYSSLGERIHEGRYVRITIPNPAKQDIQTIHFTVDAVRTLDNTIIGRVRDRVWSQGLVAERDVQSVSQNQWDLNISPKVQFAQTDPITITSIPENLWVHTIKYRITATITTFAGRVSTSSTEVDTINSGSTPSDTVLLPRPFHALWHTPYTSAGTQDPWASIYMSQWLKINRAKLHYSDRVADEDAVDDTLPGHEFASAVTEGAFYPSGGYPTFRGTAVKALDSNQNASERTTARNAIATWITSTRNHLNVVLDDQSIAEVWIGNGSWCATTTPPDVLPEHWMYDLLVTGKIVISGTTMLDVSDSVGGDWTHARDKLFNDCVYNTFIDLRIDRCLIGELPHGPCSTGRTIIVRHTTITTPPASQSVDSGQPARLNVVADGTNLRYQWYEGALHTYQSPLVGETGDTLNVSPTVSTAYWVHVSGDDGDDAAGATILVNGTGGPCTEAPTVTSQPPSVEYVNASSAAFLSLGVTGSGLHYQWFQVDNYGDSTMIGGANLPTYTTSTPGVYFVRVSNSCGTVDSASSYVLAGSTCMPVQYMQYNASRTDITIGDSIALGIFVQGQQPISVEWFQVVPDGPPVSVGTGTSVTVTPPADQTQYYAFVWNDCGSRILNNITINVCTPPAITQQPTVPPPFVQFGQTTTLYVGATGSNLHYRWTASGAGYGTDSPTLLIQAQSASIFYSCTVSNECGTVDSITIVVDPPCPQIAITAQPQSTSLVRGHSTTLSATASSASALTYQWERKLPAESAFTDVTGANGTTLVISPVDDGTQYRIRVTNGCSTVESDAATITVTPCVPASISQTFGAFVVQGQAASAGVVAAGTDLQYAWYAGAPSDTSAPLGFTTSTITVSPLNTQTYWVRLTALCGSPVDSAPIVINVCANPSITAQPQSVSVFSGGSATLTVAASVATPTPLTYQWYSGQSGPIQGATNASYTTPPLTTDTSYWVAVSAGICGPTQSDTATVTMCGLQANMPAPSSLSIALGQTAHLVIPPFSPANGSTFFWYQGASGDTTHPLGDFGGDWGPYNYIDVSPTVTTQYWAQIKHGSCISNTGTATVSVCIPTITQQPTGVMINSGQSTTLTVAANTLGLTYQWYVGTSGTTTSPISGATNASYSATPSATTSYWVRVTGSCGQSADSNTATVTICQAPSITSQPAGASIVRGQSFTLYTAATGTNLSYQWYQGTSGVTTSPVGGNSTSFTVSPINPVDYWVKVTGTCGSANSNTAHVSVCTTPTINTQPQSSIVFSGGNATLTVSAAEATGEPMHYQWHRGTISSSVNVGTDSASYNTGALSADTSYYVTITAGQCAIDSSAATVSICTYPQSVTGAPNQNSSPGQSVHLQIPTNPGVTAYLWYRGVSGDTSNPIGGWQAANYIDVSPTTTTSYWAQWQANSGSCVSNTTTTTVSVCIPVITQQPASVTIPSGSTTLSVISNLLGSTYQWYIGASGTTSSPLSGQTSASLTVSPATTTTYWCRVTGPCATANSNAATVTICSPPVITHQPANAASYANSPNTLIVTATGTNLTYQWYFGASGDTSNPFSGRTTNTLSLNPVTSTQYWVRVTGMCGFVNSASAWMSVYPTIQQQPQQTTYLSQGSRGNLTVIASGTGLHYQWFGPSGLVGTDSPTLVTPDINTTSSFYCAISSAGGATTNSYSGDFYLCDGPYVIGITVANTGGNCRNLAANIYGNYDNIYWYQGARGDISHPAGSGAALNVCPTASTTYWFRATNTDQAQNVSCYTDSAAVTVP